MEHYGKYRRHLEGWLSRNDLDGQENTQENTVDDFFDSEETTLEKPFKTKTNFLDDGKLLTLYHIYLKGFLGHSHIKELVYPEKTKSCVYKALKILDSLALVNRQDFTLGHGKGSLESTYHLTRKGFNVLKNAGFIYDDLEYNPPKTHLSFGSYQHRQTILDYWVSLEKQCEEYPKFHLESFYPDWQSIIGGRQIKLSAYDNYYKDTLIVKPDGTFVIKNTKTGERYLFFLEVDMGTIPIVSSGHMDISGKLQRYQLLFSKLAFQHLRPEFKDFTEARVIFFTDSQKRLESTLEKAHISHQIKHLFLFSTISNFKAKGSLASSFKIKDHKTAFNMFTKDYMGNE